MDYDPVMSVKAVTRFYEDHHAQNAKVGTGRIASRQRIGHFVEWVGKGKDLLDLGCRDGELTSHYMEGNRVTGCDIDRNALTIAAKRGIDAHYADLNEELPFGEKQFDVVVTGEVLEHVMFPPMTVKEIARVLRPDGMLVGSVPNGYRLKARRQFLFGGDVDTNPFHEHLHTFAVWTLRRMLEQYFENVYITAVGGNILGPWKVGAKTPRRIAFWFAKDLVFRARGVRGK
jgi:2-polyprenyl-3-methyl-5-hydroxy-6-metoxy-1,4-benzoquinol methylase